MVLDRRLSVHKVLKILVKVCFENAHIILYSHSTKIDPNLKIPCRHYFNSYSCLNMLKYSNNHTIPQSPSVGWYFKTNLNNIKVFVLKICFDQCLQIAKIAMSPSYFVHIWYIYLMNLKGVSYPPPKKKNPFRSYQKSSRNSLIIGS